MPVTSRREFLATSALATAALAGLPQRPLVADDAAKPKAPSSMKLSLAAYSFNRVLKRSPSPKDLEAAEMALEDFADYCASLGLEGTELTGYYFPTFPRQPVSFRINPPGTRVPLPPSPTFGGSRVSAEEARYLIGLKGHCFRLGLDVSGTAIGNDFCFDEKDPRRGQQIADCKAWIDRAAILGAPCIRIFAGKQRDGQTEQQAIALCTAGINECLKHAALRGVVLALENHGGITATPDQMLAIIEGVDDSPWFGVNFDSGNFRTDDPYRDLARIAPLAVNAQIKVAIHPAGGEKQPADLDRIVGILKDAGYRGYVVLEYEEQDPREHIPRYLDQLRKLI
jgi:sugar phosphate isomerase/epimerase